MWTKRDKRLGDEHVETFKRVAAEAYGVDIEALAKARQHAFWIVGIDENENVFRDLRGNIDAESMRAINARFFNTDAGFRASAQNHLPGLKVPADIYLINTAHLSKKKYAVAPVIVHEIAHYLEQIGEAPNYAIEAIDEANGQVVLAGLDPEVRSREHTRLWANLVARAARLEVVAGRYGSIRSFLEQAIPAYDRPHWRGIDIQEPAA